MLIQAMAIQEQRLKSTNPLAADGIMGGYRHKGSTLLSFKMSSSAPVIQQSRWRFASLSCEIHKHGRSKRGRSKKHVNKRK